MKSLGFPAEGWQVIFQQGPASRAGCFGCSIPEGAAGCEPWQCHSTWQDGQGLWALGSHPGL